MRQNCSWILVSLLGFMSACSTLPSNEISPVITPVDGINQSTLPHRTPVERFETITITLERIAEGLARPTYLTHAGDERLFVVEQPGRVRIMQQGTLLSIPFLDITSKVRSASNEQGLFSVAFASDYVLSGRFFVNYTRERDGATVVESYLVSNDPDQANPDTAEQLLVISQPEPNHNGGQIKFGPDGFLYIGTGDGGGAGDRHGRVGNAQNPGALLGKLLRIDVSPSSGYTIPPDNPFIQDSRFQPEIWALGLRNPWRFSFDRQTGDLFIADVGQGAYEEVNVVSRDSQGGDNFGWRIMEGAQCFNPQTGCDPSGLTMPIAEYGREDGCSITGGYVYRGELYPWLEGLYFFGDYCSGKVWTLEPGLNGDWIMVERLSESGRISSFGEDQRGELYLIDHRGDIYQIISKNP